MASDSLFESLRTFIQDKHIIEGIEERQQIAQENTEHINKFIVKRHCNIINYMPIELMRIVINKQYRKSDLKYPLYVFFRNTLHPLEILEGDPYILKSIEGDIIYATTVKTISVDYLEAYIPHSFGGL